jgi:predicted metal-dependent RNase
MHLHCISGIGEVGASCLVVAAADRRVLVDAGIRMGSPDPLPDLAQLQEGGASTRWW